MFIDLYMGSKGRCECYMFVCVCMLNVYKSVHTCVCAWGLLHSCACVGMHLSLRMWLAHAPVRKRVCVCCFTERECWRQRHREREKQIESREQKFVEIINTSTVFSLEKNTSTKMDSNISISIMCSFAKMQENLENIVMETHSYFLCSSA